MCPSDRPAEHAWGDVPPGSTFIELTVDISKYKALDFETESYSSYQSVQCALDNVISAIFVNEQSCWVIAILFWH